MRLIEAPVGLFLWKGTLCLKTEYIDEKWGVEAYIVSSGETFWGGAKTKEERHNLEVTPVEAEIPSHARWHKLNETKLTRTVECTHCNATFRFKKEGPIVADKLPRCPVCGAKMDKEG